MLASKTATSLYICLAEYSEPEVYLKLVTEAQKGAENAISSTFAPVTQFKF
jgi:hypothetical protein